MMITTSDEFSALLHASLDDAPPTILEMASEVVETLDPEGLHVAVLTHGSGAVVHSLWLVKLYGRMDPQFVWLRTPAAEFAAATTQTQTVTPFTAFA